MYTIYWTQNKNVYFLRIKHQWFRCYRPKLQHVILYSWGTSVNVFSLPGDVVAFLAKFFQPKFVNISVDSAIANSNTTITISSAELQGHIYALLDTTQLFFRGIIKGVIKLILQILQNISKLIHQNINWALHISITHCDAILRQKPGHNVFQTILLVFTLCKDVMKILLYGLIWWFLSRYWSQMVFMSICDKPKNCYDYDKYKARGFFSLGIISMASYVSCTETTQDAPVTIIY